MYSRPLGILLSLGFTYLAVRGLDLGELRTALARQQYVYLVPAGAALAVAVVLRTWRWQLLFAPQSRPRFGHVGNALLVGYLFNTILPLRAGELARVGVLGRRARVSRAEVLTTVVLERAYDLVLLVLLLAVAVPFLPPVEWLPAALSVGAAGVIVMGVAAAVALHSGAPGLQRLIRPLAWLPGVDTPRLERLARGAMAGLASVGGFRAAGAATVTTAASWIALALSTHLLLLGTDLDVGFGAAVLVVVATNLILAVPSSPAAVGAFEAAVIVALAAHGVARADALSFALVLHALNALPYLVTGYVALVLHARARPDDGDWTALTTP